MTPSAPVCRVFLIGLMAFGSESFSSVGRAAESAATVPAKRIYVAMDDHTDCMSSADEAYYRQAFVEMIDFYLEEMERTARRPNVAPEPRRFSLSLASGIERAQRTSHIETDLANAEVSGGTLSETSTAA